MDAQEARRLLFRAGNYRAVEFHAEDVPSLQRFFDCNPEYFLAINGQPATAAEAHEEIFGELPTGWPYTKKWVLAFVDDSGDLAGMANVVSDLLAPHVWHIGLFMIATPLHGTGVARALYEHLESWARDSGAQWLRLGVVEGNQRAERFWERAAFAETRKRHGVQMGQRINTLRVMAKPLAGGSLPDYLAMVARDRPES